MSKTITYDGNTVSFQGGIAIAVMIGFTASIVSEIGTSHAAITTTLWDIVQVLLVFAGWSYCVTRVYFMWLIAKAKNDEPR